MKISWIDIRNLGPNRDAILEEVVHQRIEAVFTDKIEDLVGLPPTIDRCLHIGSGPIPSELENVDILLLDGPSLDRGVEVAALPEHIRVGRYVEIDDSASLDQACDSCAVESVSVLRFADPTKIPLEIALAAAAGNKGTVITTVESIEEAVIVFGVLEHGSDGVMLQPTAVGDATALADKARGDAPNLDLVELEIQSIARAGMGDRVAVDTCTHFRPDEGILVGSHSKGMILCCSETHPLPYMKTRPFRVNAGALHSYTVSPKGMTNYLSELGHGSQIIGVDVEGRSRVLTVGRVKIETRPMLSINALGPDGREVNLIVQDDWHVRVLGPEGRVLNVTELVEGMKVMGYLPTEDRHVGYPIDEFCIEK